MKKYHKITQKLFKKHFTRFLAITFILVFSVSLVFAVGAVTKKVCASADKYYKDYNVSDLVIKTSNPLGFSKEEIDLIDERYQTTSKQMFAEVNDYRFHFLDLETKINKLTLLEGNLPNSNEVLAERKTSCIKDYKIGDEIEFNGIKYKVSGIVLNPYYFQKKDEPLLSDNDKNVSGIFYLNINEYLPINDIYVVGENRNVNALSKTYTDYYSIEKDYIESNIVNSTVLTLKENASFATIYSLSDKIDIIGWILMIAFMIVSSLLILTTISRLIEEERPVTATLKTLGYSDSAVLFQYMVFTILAILLGSALSYPVGYYLISLIYVNFDQYFEMPQMVSSINNLSFFVSVLCMMGVGILTALYSSISLVKEKPASLLQRKAPKPAKKILLERFPFLWNKISFKYKCTFRNLFRNKKHFFMTVVSILGSTILVFLASGLLSYSLSEPLLGSALRFLCLIILAFAGALTAVIIYVLTTINISERKRELATFTVLGYFDSEVCGHIYREIYIMSLIGVVIGLPLGAYILSLVFSVLGFGSMNDVSWIVYLETPILVLLFTFLVTLLLRKKITSIDMNESLKSLE